MEPRVLGRGRGSRRQGPQGRAAVGGVRSGWAGCVGWARRAKEASSAELLLGPWWAPRNTSETETQHSLGRQRPPESIWGPRGTGDKGGGWARGPGGFE